MNPKGRPTNDKKMEVQHEEKPKKTQVFREYWTEHRITLIAYQAQYMKAKQPIQEQQGQKKSPKARKRVNLNYQSSFLLIDGEKGDQFEAQKYVKDYKHLKNLFEQNQDENMMYVRQFIKILLQLKHQKIVRQFCHIYNIAVQEISKVNFGLLLKQQNSRHQYLQGVKNKILDFIDKNKNQFPYFVSYLKEDQKQTKKLILVEVYCLLAQKYNFNINEFYSEAFATIPQSNPTKKHKKG